MKLFAAFAFAAGVLAQEPDYDYFRGNFGSTTTEEPTIPPETTYTPWDTSTPEPGTTETDPYTTESTPVVTGTDPYTTESTPVETGTDPYTTESTPVVTGTDPYTTESTPVVTGTNPYTTDTTESPTTPPSPGTDIFCHTCHATNMTACLEEGEKLECPENASVCQIEVRKRNGSLEDIRMGCKSRVACLDNKKQNFVGQWGRHQCQPFSWWKKGPSVCRQCCTGPECTIEVMNSAEETTKAAWRANLLN